jgi:hypothetical protein
VLGSLWSYPGRKRTGSASAILTVIPLPVETVFSCRKTGIHGDEFDSSLIDRAGENGRVNRPLMTEREDGDAERAVITSVLMADMVSLSRDPRISDTGREREGRGSARCWERGTEAERDLKRNNRFTFSRGPARFF